FFKVKEESGDEVIQDQDHHDRVNDRFGHRTANAARAADGLEPLVAANDANDQGENERFEKPFEHVTQFDDLTEVAETSLEGKRDFLIRNTDHRAANPSDEDGENNQE